MQWRDATASWSRSSTSISWFCGKVYYCWKFKEIFGMIVSDESREINTICFLMCKSCYWCASYSTNRGKHISICPLCGSNKLQCSTFHTLMAQRILELMSNYDLHSQDHFASRMYVPLVIKCITRFIQWKLLTNSRTGAPISICKAMLFI